MIIVKNHKCSIDKLKKDYPEAVIIDVTSHAKDEFIRLSPFYPLGGIPVPFSPGWRASCVESIWQGLKDYESVGTDINLFKNTSMKSLKRTTRRFGHLRGHRKGVASPVLLDYVEARKLLYIPTYKWVLENKVQSEVDKIRDLSQHHTVILLDYATNPVVEDASSPLSHAALIKAFIEGNYPSYDGPEGDGDDKEKPFENPFSIGQRVRHQKFGEGTVTELDGDRARVSFDEVGEKLLALRFAKLEIIENHADMKNSQLIEIRNGGEKFIRICKKNGKKEYWGFMDGNGNEAIPCRYLHAEPFADGLAEVEDEQRRFFITESGDTAFICHDDYQYGLFDEGRCEIRPWDEDRHGYVNKRGEIISPIADDEPEWERFSEGLRVDDYDDLSEWVNENENVVIVARDLDFYNGSDFHDRLASASHTKYGRYGYLDQRGQVVIPFVFTNAFTWDHGMAPVSMDGKWGFTDMDMNVLIPFQYYFGDHYQYPRFDQDGIMLYRKAISEDPDTGFGRDFIYGAIDRSGRELIPVDTGDDLSENHYYGIAKIDGKIAVLTDVKNEEGEYEWGVKWFNIESQRADDIVYRFECEDILLMKVAKLKEGHLCWGFENADGEEVIHCIFDDAMVRDGIIRVKKEGLWAFVSPAGKFLTSFVYQSAFAPFAEGLSAVQRKDLWGFVNMKGEEVVPCEYDSATDFKEGRSMVLKDECYGFIDLAGNEVTPLVYDMAYPFSDGLAWVQKINKRGSINLEGKEVIPCVFDWVGECSEGLVAVRNTHNKHKHFKIMDIEGNVIIDLSSKEQDGISIFKEGLCGIRKGWEWGFIDRTGKEVIPCKFKWPYFNAQIQFDHGLCLFQSTEQWRAVGCINTKGEVVIPAEYLRIDWVEDNKWAAQNGEETHYYNIEGKRI